MTTPEPFGITNALDALDMIARHLRLGLVTEREARQESTEVLVAYGNALLEAERLGTLVVVTGDDLDREEE